MRDFKSMDDEWFSGVTGVVVDTDDPERRHRVKIEMPIIKEGEPHGEWVTLLAPYVGPDGYGAVHPPAIGSEVRVFGAHCQSTTLFAIPHYNETHRVPVEFSGGEFGGRFPAPWQILSDGFVKLVAQQVVQIIAAREATIEGSEVRLGTQSAYGVRVRGERFASHGQAPIARRALPPDARDMPTCVTLANALKALLIDLGPAR